MKVIFPFAYYYPEQCAGLFVLHDVSEALAMDGIESLIYVPTPTRNVPKNAHWEKDEYLNNGKIHIHRFAMYGESRNPLLRALRYLLCEIVYTHKLLWSNYDVIFLDSTPPIQGLKLALVHLFRDKPVVYNAQDLFPDSLVGAGLTTKDSMLWKIGNWIANITYHHCDKIITISEDCKQTLINKRVPENKISVIYNWVDENAIVPIAKKDNPLYKEFGLNKDLFRIVYAGNLGIAQNIDVIIKTAIQLKDNKNIEFVLFGSGGLEKNIKQQIIKENLTNTKIFPLQPTHKVSFVYSLGDLCIVCCKAGFGGSAMPSKTWSILSTARPVLASFDEGELQHMLEVNDFGIFTKADDVNAMVNAILTMSKNPDRCNEMGRKGRAYIEKYLTKDKNTKKYVDIIKNVGK